MLATFVLGIVVGGRLNDKKGPRLVVFLGGLMFCAGIFLSSLVPQDMPWLIYLFYGGMAGFGVGAAYTSTISCAQKMCIRDRLTAAETDGDFNFISRFQKLSDVFGLNFHIVFVYGGGKAHFF